MKRVLVAAVAGLLMTASPAAAQHGMQLMVTDPCDSSSRGMLGFSMAGVHQTLIQKYPHRVVCVEGAENEDMRDQYLMASLLVAMRLKAVAMTLDPQSPFLVRYWSDSIEKRVQDDMMKRLERRIVVEDMDARQALVAEVREHLDWMRDFVD